MQQHLYQVDVPINLGFGGRGQFFVSPPLVEEEESFPIGFTRALTKQQELP